jgi:hypothetical protein
MNYPQIVVGGVGGSGTRLIAMILISLGLNMGNDINESLDNLTYTLFFKRKDILTIPDEEFEKLLKLFETSFKSKSYTNDELKYIFSLTKIYRPRHPKEWLVERAKNIINKGNSTNKYMEIYQDKIKNISTNKKLYLDGYGFKEPNSHIILEKLIRQYSKMKYIHVMRNGLDMAFSDNQNQVKFWGWMYLSKSDFTNINYASLKYWVIIHKKIIEIGEKLGPERFLLINFDKMCAKPNKWLKKLCKFLNISTKCRIGLKYLIDPPSDSIGKFRKHDISIFDPEDIAYVKKLGFDII